MRLIAGHNRVNYNDVENPTDLSPSTSNEIVIDSSLLGGMYVERLSIVANNKGTGVHMRGDMASSVGDISLRADGSITVGRVSSSGRLKVTSTNKGITSKRLSALKTIELKAQESINLESVTSDEEILIESIAGSISLTDASAGGKISISSLNNIAFNLLNSNKDIILSSMAGDVSGAEITSKEAITVDAGGKIEISGDIVSDSSDVSLIAGAAITYNRLSAGQDAFLQAGDGDISLDKETRVGRNLELASSSALLNWSGKTFDNISAPGLVTITAQNADLSGGTFRFSDVLFSITNDLNLSGADVKNGKDSNANITIDAGSLTTSSTGELIAEKNLYLTLSQSSTNHMIIGSLGDTVITMNNGANLTNEATGVIGARENLGLFLSGALDNLQGSIITQNGDLIIAGIGSGITHSTGGGFVIGNVNDLADISTDRKQAVKFNNNDGLIESGKDLIIAAEEVENTRDSATSTKAIHAQNDLSIISAGDIINNGGLLTANNNIHLKGLNLLNSNNLGATGEIIANNFITGDFTGLIDNIVIQEQTNPNHTTTSINILGSLITFNQLPPLSSANGDQTSSGTRLDSLASLTNIAGGESLFQLSTGDTFIFETRLEFIDVDLLFGSAYFLERIQYDQEEDVRFIGDAYFETQLIEQAILDQTGERFLDETTNTATEQFKKLLDNGAETQKELDLKLGVALTSIQINALSKNIVWYVERTVNGQKVLVPEVYLAKHKSFELVKNGALIKAKDVLLKSRNGINNRGGRINTSGDLTLISEDGTIHLVAESRKAKKDYRINGRKGEFSAGGKLTLAAQSIKIEGFKLHSSGNLEIRAKENVAIKSYQIKKRRSSVSTTENVLAEITTESNAEIVAESGDLTITGAVISADRHINLAAGNDINIFAVQDTYSRRSRGRRQHEFIDRTTSQKNKITAGEDLTTYSQGDTIIQASQLEAGERADGNLTILGGGNVAIVSGEDTYNYDYYRKKKKWYGSTKVTRIRRHKETTVSSQLKAKGDVKVLSKGDVDIGASNVEAGENLRVAAGVDVDEYIRSQTPEELPPSGEEGNVNILTNEEIESYYRYRKKSGFFSGGGKGSFSFGYKKEKHTTKSETATHVLSFLSAGKNVVITATGNINADAPLIAAKENIELQANRDIKINSIYDLFRYHESHKVSQFGVTVSLFENITSSYKALAGLPKALSSGKGSTGAKAITAASASLRAIDAVNSLAGGQIAGARLALGLSKSKSSFDQKVISSKGAIIQAGKDVIIKSGRDTSIEGASIAANNNVKLDAKRDLILKAGKSSREERSSNKSSSLGVSVSVGVNIVGGVGISAGIDGSFNKAKSSANSTNYTYTQIQAGNEAKLNSGRDTKLKGAQVGAKTIIATVGRDLTIESLQNTSSYKSSSVGFSFGLSTDLGGFDSGVNITPDNLLNHALGNGSGTDVPVGDRAVPIIGESGYRGAFGQLLNDQGLISKGQLLDGGQPNGLQFGGSGWNVGFSISKGKGYFAWVEQQSRLLADGKVDITVKEHTQLIAGVIASKSKDLTLDTGTIGYRDLVDVDKRKDYGGSLSLSGPLSGGGNKSQEKAGNPNELGFSVDGSYSSKNKEGISRATVGEGEIVVRDKAKQKELEESGQTQKLANLNRDLDKAQEVTKDEVTEVNLYVSDTSLRTAFKGVELVGRALEEVAADVFSNTGGETADLKEIGNALKNKNLSMESLVSQLAACGGNQGFNWHDLIFSKAYASEACQIKDNKGNVIRTLKPEEHETCNDIISTLLVNDPNWLDNHKKKFENCSGTECPSLLIPAGEFFEALGRRGAVINGQRAVFVDENGNENHLNSADGSPIYYNPLSGKFFANDADLEIQDSFILASGGIGGTIRRFPLSGVKVATRLVVPGRVQSRINLQNGTKEFGMIHILKNHLSSKINKSQFTMTEKELRTILQSSKVVKSPIVKTLNSDTHGTLYVRQVDIGKTIGRNYHNKNKPTSVITVQSDKFGNIITAHPGK